MLPRFFPPENEEQPPQDRYRRLWSLVRLGQREYQKLLSGDVMMEMQTEQEKEEQRRRLVALGRLVQAEEQCRRAQESLAVVHAMMQEQGVDLSLCVCVSLSLSPDPLA